MQIQLSCKGIPYKFCTISNNFQIQPSYKVILHQTRTISRLSEPRSSLSDAKSSLPAYNLLQRSLGSSFAEHRSSHPEARSLLPACRSILWFKHCWSDPQSIKIMLTPVHFMHGVKASIYIYIYIYMTKKINVKRIYIKLMILFGLPQKMKNVFVLL